MTQAITAPRRAGGAGQGRGLAARAGPRTLGGAWRRGAGPGARRAGARARRQVSGEDRNGPAGGRAGMAEQWDLDEEGICRLGALNLEHPGRAGLGAWGLRLRGGN